MRESIISKKTFADLVSVFFYLDIKCVSGENCVCGNVARWHLRFAKRIKHLEDFPVLTKS